MLSERRREIEKGREGEIEIQGQAQTEQTISLVPDDLPSADYKHLLGPKVP